jgi:toxin ParE1/3/4
LNNHAAALRVAQAIYDGIARLGDFPGSGKSGRMEGTRELALPPLPYVIVYRVLERADGVEIINVIHGAQRWPPN